MGGMMEDHIDLKVVEEIAARHDQAARVLYKAQTEHIRTVTEIYETLKQFVDAIDQEQEQDKYQLALDMTRETVQVMRANHQQLTDMVSQMLLEILRTHEAASEQKRTD